MFKRIIALEVSEGSEQAIPLTRGVEVTEKDLADAASYLAALQNAYAQRQTRSQAYPIDKSIDDMQEAMLYCQMNFFC